MNFNCIISKMYFSGFGARLRLAVSLILLSAGGVWAQDCTNAPQAKITGAGDPPRKIDITCSDGGAFLGVSVFGSSSFNIDSITWTVEGSTGATITPLYDDGSLLPFTALMTITSADGKAGTATVKVTVAYHLTNPACSGSGSTPLTDTVDYDIVKDAGGCGSCNGGGGDNAAAGSGSCQVQSVHVTLGLGRYDQFLGAGLLTIDAETPSTDLSKATGLKYNYKRQNVAVTYSTGTLIQQIKAPETLAQIVDTDPNDSTYSIQFYYSQDVTYNSTTHLYVPNSGAQPFVTWTISNPSGNVNILQISNTRGETYTYTYNTTTAVWSLTEPGNLRTVQGWTATSGLVTDLYRQILSGGTVVERTQKEYQTIGGLNYLSKKVTGDGSTTETTSYTLIGSGTSQGKPSRIDYPDGRWEMFEYDSFGRVITRYESYADMAPPTAGNFPLAGTCRKTTYSYASVSGSPDWGGAPANSNRDLLALVEPATARETIGYSPYYDVSAWTWAKVSHQFFWAPAPDTTVSAISVNPGSASWDDAANLVTTKVSYIDPADTQSYGRLKLLVKPDGTGTLYSYSVDGSGNTTTTESTGELNSDLTSIVNGIQTVTLRNSLGRVSSVVTKYIANGGTPSTVMASQAYSYTGGPLLENYSVVDLGNRLWQYNYDSCCGRLTSEVDPDGKTTSYTYDSLNRRVAVTTLFGATGYTMTKSLDAAGRVLATLRSPTAGGTTQTNSQRLYDVLGRVTSETNALGGVTTYAYDTVNHLITTTYPDGGTKVTAYFADGNVKKVSGTAVAGMRYALGVQPYGSPSIYRETTQEIRLDTSGSDTSESTLTTKDDLARTLRIYFNKATTPLPYSENIYNSRGQLVSQKDPDGVTQLFAYDTQGRLSRRALDMNGNGTIDPTDGVSNQSDDRITDTIFDVVAASDYPNNTHGVDIVRSRRFVFTTDDSTTTNLVAIVETSTDGLKKWQTSYPATSTPIVTYSQTVYGANGLRTETGTNPDGSSNIRSYNYSRITSVQEKNASGSQITLTTYAYDGYGRLASETDARNGTISYTYNNADQRLTLTAPTLGNGQAVQFTQFFYDNLGRQTGQVLPDNTSVTNLYFATGLLQKTWGSRIYPVQYAYNGQGRMTTMTTWQNFIGNSGSAVTSWNYDSYRGWLVSKYYANPTTGAAGTQGPTYAYTDGGRLKSRTWMRGVITTYAYETAAGSGWTSGSLRRVDYTNDPANTPSTTYTYDRRGRRATVLRNGITTTNYYNEVDQPLSETYTGGTLDGLSVVRSYDGRLQLSSLDALKGSAYLQRATYAYDSDGRLSQVTDTAATAYSATYGYAANSLLISSLAFTNNATGQGMLTSRSYDVLNRLSNISSQPYTNSAANGLPISYAYQYNQGNQRTRADLGDSSYWIYTYDALGQVSSGNRFWNDGTAVVGQQFQYAFDDIGNRRMTGGRASAVSSYANNYQNQITSRSVAGTIDVLGIANPTAPVTVNTLNANRHGEYFQFPLAVNNTSAAQYPTVTVLSTFGATQTNSGQVFVPPATETFGYDTDGNMTSDGRWATYVWDGENRLVEMRRDSGTPSLAQQRLTFEYDFQGRRIRKAFFTWVSGAWAKQRDTVYLYDGWNMVAELDAINSNAKLRTYVWGNDLSGTRIQAGGVGGLLWVNNAQSTYNGLSVPTGVQFAAYDGNGNVAGLVAATDGTVTSRYEYGPFGESLRTSGALAKVNPVRFSTKVTDNESGLVFYGYRYYNPVEGRWLGRDPSMEQGGNNLYCLFYNASGMYVDTDGRSPLLIIIPVGAAAIVGAGAYLYNSCKPLQPTLPISQTIAACSITIYVGHGFVDNAFDNDGKLKNPGSKALIPFPTIITGDPNCSACAVVSCNAAKLVSVSNPIPGYTMRDDEIMMRNNIDSEIQAAYDAAVAHAATLCSINKCTCGSITVNVICTGSAAGGFLRSAYQLCGKTTVIPCSKK